LTYEEEDSIKREFQELGTRAHATTRVINFLNSKESEQLKAKGISEKTTMVMEPENILKKGIYFNQLKINAYQ
jgi:hypothetical protein